MKFFALVLILTSFHAFSSELRCSGNLLQIKATLAKDLKTLTNLTVFRYDEGRVTKDKARKVEGHASGRNRLSFPLPGADTDANESWDLILPKDKLSTSESFNAKIHYYYCVGDDVAAVTCYVSEN